MRKVFSYIGPYKWAALVAFMLMLVELAVELVQPLIMAKIIDEGVVAGNLHTVILWGSIMLGLGVLAFIAGLSNGFFSGHAAQSFAYDLRVALFKKVQSYSMHSFLKIPTSSMITRITNDVTQVQNIFFMSLRFMMRAPLVVIGSLIMAFLVNAKLAIFLVIGIPFLLIFLWFMVRKGAKNFGKVQRRVDQVNRNIQENLQATRLIKAYMRGIYESTKFNKLAVALKTDTMKALRLMERIQPVLLIVMNGALLVILWFGAKEIQADRMPVGDLVAIFNYTMRITGNFSMFAMIITFFSRASASANRMNEILSMDEVQTVQENKERSHYYVEARHITFKYDEEGKAILHDVSFAANRGDTIAVMGATGSGKSSLLQLLPRLYDATEGTMFVEGKDVKSYEPHDLRQKIGYVPQRSLLFTGTIFENITWGNEHATLEEVEHVCKIAQIHETIMRFPDGYETRVGQKGVNLSGGQKQRIAIARALIRQPELFIFDDSMSALDLTTEAKLWQALNEYEDATRFVVTQKVATAKSATRILLMDQGEVVAQGTHEELLENSELYREIVASQQEVNTGV